MQCLQCQRTFRNEEMIAAMAGSIMGDEHSDAYYWCPKCGVYTVSKCWDNFTGDETWSVEGPVSRAEGDKRVALIRQCERPWDKKCRCPAHRAYFGSSLD